jgi:hypothetical protein
MKSFIAFFAFLLLAVGGFGQVNNIKNASASSGGNSSGSSYSGGDNYSGSAFMADFMFNFMFGGVVEVQQQKLARKHEVPTMISLDLIAQTAVQPSSYYIVHPRVRGNWGLFSTDFRMNYLIEDGIDGYKHIRTSDWQILQVNVITTRDFTARIGGGFMQEAFEGYKTFSEWTVGFHYQSDVHPWGAFAEYRGAEVRKEVSSFAQYRLFDAKYFHGFATAGFVYQRYYRSITTWGLQGGLMVRIY